MRVTSEAFDTYLLLLDSQNEVVEENNNISYQNRNSSITLEVPETGKYRALVMSNGNGRGRYSFKVKEATKAEKEKLEADNLLELGIEEYKKGQFQEAIRSWELAGSLYNILRDSFEDVSALQEGEGTTLGKYWTSLCFFGRLFEGYFLSGKEFKFSAGNRPY